MFDRLRKRESSGPILFELDLLIERPVEEVYPLVDWADSRNARRQLGDGVEGDGRRFVLTMTDMPDLRFHLDVSEARPSEVYAYTCDIRPKVGKLDFTSERFEFEHVDQDHCLIRLRNEAKFVDGLTAVEMKHELWMMTMASNDALLKLKVMAELGVNAARALENKTDAL